MYDTVDDTTVPFLTTYAQREPRLRAVLNTLGRGPANACVSASRRPAADVVVVTMADGSDDPMQIDQLTRLVERGVVVACASRYMRGGQQVGGPWVKGRISRLAGVSLNLMARVGTHDATNSFKAYSRDVRRSVWASTPTPDSSWASSWSRRPAVSVFRWRSCRPSGSTAPTAPPISKCSAWIPRYLHWYLYALGLTGRETPVPRSPPGRGTVTRVLVTGSAGFIGGYVVEELLERGYEVVGVDNEIEVRSCRPLVRHHPATTGSMQRRRTRRRTLMAGALDRLRSSDRRRSDDRRHLVLPHLRLRPAGDQRADPRGHVRRRDSAHRDGTLTKVTYLSSSMVFEFSDELAIGRGPGARDPPAQVLVRIPEARGRVFRSRCAQPARASVHHRAAVQLRRYRRGPGARRCGNSRAAT